MGTKNTIYVEGGGDYPLSKKTLFLASFQCNFQYIPIHTNYWAPTLRAIKGSQCLLRNHGWHGHRHWWTCPLCRSPSPSASWSFRGGQSLGLWDTWHACPGARLPRTLPQASLIITQLLLLSHVSLFYCYYSNNQLTGAGTRDIYLPRILVLKYFWWGQNLTVLMGF